MENKVNAVIDASTRAKVEAAFDGMIKDLPFLIELSPVESQRLLRMEAGRIDFVRKALILARSNPNIQPKLFEFKDFENDLTLTQHLDVMIDKAEAFVKLLKDTRDQAGNEAYMAALEVYHTSKRGAAKGVEGAQTAYEELKGMFDKQRNNAKKGVNYHPQE
jgi:hypothetical protein